MRYCVRLQSCEEKVREISDEKAAVEEVLTQEIEDLRLAHNKSLEMLMSYQEENDLLRAAVSTAARHGVLSS